MLNFIAQSTADMEAAAGAAMAGLAIFFIIYLAIIVVVIAGMWKVFAKAGKPGWAAIVPIYNTIILLEIVGKPVWWILLCLIPVVNFVVILIVLNELSKAFGRGIGTTIALVFAIGWPVLGFGSAQYKGAPAAA